MAWDGLRVLAVIPARGGSRGVPRKNLRQVGGLSLIARAARLASGLAWIDRVVISTDDEAMASEAVAHGASAPFRRPADLSGDEASSVDAWRHAWLESERLDEARYDLSLLLEPTSPLRRVRDLERTVSALLAGDHRAAATVSRAPGHFTPHKSLLITDRGTLAFFLSDGERYTLRQRIPPIFYRNGLCYAARRETVVDARRIVEEDCVAVPVDRPVINIDEEVDLGFAEYLLSREASIDETSSKARRHPS